MRSSEIPTWDQVQDQGCGWGVVSIKVQPMVVMLEADLSLEEEGNNLEEGGNPQLWIVRDAGNNSRSTLLTQCTTLVQGGPSP